MTRLELLQLLTGQARKNGFQYRRWYSTWLGQPWDGARKATEVLCEGRRYYALLFCADFAENFWKAGERMTVQVQSQRFQRRMPDGTTGTVVRKGFTRRLTRPNAWQYHVRQMAVAEDPLRYIRRFLRVKDDLAPEPAAPETPVRLNRDPRFILDEEDLLPDDDV